MINIDTKVSQIYEYLVDIIQLSPEEIRAVKAAIGILHEVPPTDAPVLFSKIDRLISISEDLSWVISMITKKQHQIKSSIKKIKDPEFTMLVRQKRPSTQAIESEIRFNHEELTDMEENLDIIDNMIDYLKHLELGIDRTIWLLKDKISYIKQL